MICFDACDFDVSRFPMSQPSQCFTQQPEVQGDKNVVHLLCLQVVVQHVNVQGLGRTKEDLLGYEISDVFHAKNLIDVRLSPRLPTNQITFTMFNVCLMPRHTVAAKGDEEGTRGQAEAPPSGGLQRRGGPH